MWGSWLRGGGHSAGAELRAAGSLPGARGDGGAGRSPREAWSEGRRGSVSGVSCRERCPEGVPVRAAVGVGLLGASWEPSAEAAAL